MCYVWYTPGVLPTLLVVAPQIHDVMLPVMDGEVEMRVYVPTALDARQERVTEGDFDAMGVIVWLHGEYAAHSIDIACHKRLWKNVMFLCVYGMINCGT